MEGECRLQQRTFRYRLFSVGLPSYRFGGIGLALWDTTEYDALQDQLIQSEKLSGLDTLVSGMAHEMSNPMQAILGLPEHLAEETDPDTIRDIAATLHRIGKHVTAVLRDCLAYVRLTAHSSEGQIDLNERLQQAVGMVQRGPYFGQVRVITKFLGVPPITARQMGIDHVLINLITNAAQAMKGNGQLTLSTEATRSTVRVRILDTGSGIPPDQTDKIFEPFFTTKLSGHGTGLGLSIVRKIMTKYHGTIKVESMSNN